MTGPSREAALTVRVLSQQEAGERLRRAGLLAGRALLVGAALLAWSAASGTVVDAQFVSDPLSVARALAALAASGRLWPNLGQTVAEVLIGYLLGGGLGVAVALLVGVVPTAQRVLRPFLLAFYAIPKIALAPLIVMWFGLGLAPKVLLAAIFVFFVVFMNVVTGIFSVSPHLVATLRVMGASRTTLLWKVTLPSTIPYLTSGLRIGIPEAMIGAVIGEFMAATRGLGYLVNAAAAQFNTTVTLAAIAALVGVVVLMDGVLTLAEARLLRWRPRAVLAGRA
ncbi:MAG: ABC transporter permease subunit [Armatimonadota bacterium]|nr:ABC transporter permease subunit [Armatimonadota bacterium]MDR7480548.1 ABC transporter permease subunit [Armatimonadota bacterium]MDR7489171.1 ABC transporter permease subunit [Armatimonadota bacterium]MDR7491012.1 ABC transporter permease subunit [Armatimonadota bacterium]MDR7502460.1 ABC transporter permease subunit [Armatimonadota bacterium]